MKEIDKVIKNLQLPTKYYENYFQDNKDFIGIKFNKKYFDTVKKLKGGE